MLQFVFIREVFKELGTEDFAVFAAISGVLPWLQLLDFGTGQYIQNKFSAQNESEQAQEQLRSVFLVVFAIAPILLAMIAPLVMTIVTRPLDPNASKLAFVFIGVIYPGQIAYTILIRVLYARYKTNVANGLLVLSSVISIGFFSISSEFFPRDTLPIIAVTAPIFSSTVLLIAALSRAWQNFAFNFLFGFKLNFLKTLSVIKASFPFALNSLMGSLVLQTDYLIIPHTLENAEISLYAILMRIFGFALGIFSSGLIATAPYFATRHEKRIQWIFSLMAAGITGVFSIALVLILVPDQVLLLLAPGADFGLPTTTVLLLAAQQSLRVVSEVFATALIARGHVGIFIKFVPIQAALAIPLMWLLSRNFGINGLISATSISFLMTSCWILPMYYFRNEKNDAI
jgi:O-antigen/teichoic acid export membrane protein